MSQYSSNVNRGGYVPPGYAPHSAVQYPPGEVHGSYGFTAGQPQSGYPPATNIPYGTPTNYNAQNQQYYGVDPHKTNYNIPGHGYNPGYGPGSGSGPQQPITMQPSIQPGAQPGGHPGIQPPQGEWMSIPAGIPNCPRGLEYLTTVDQLLVKQKLELLEAIIGFETKNKFDVKNALGQKVYFAAEESNCCTRNMCGPNRPFAMKIFDNYRNEVIHLERPLACSSCCFPCCLQTLEISAPPGNVIGTIEQEWSILTPQFKVKNHIGDTVLRIEGPFCTFSCFGDVEFQVLSLTGEVVGKISKQWAGLAREIFTDADFFGITFPRDLDVRIKAVLLGATFLIDAMFFERAGNRETGRPGMM